MADVPTRLRELKIVPVIVIDSGETGAMAEAVEAAAGLASPGDTVLMAPGCASRDMWTWYDARGRDFTEAARRAAGQQQD